MSQNEISDYIIKNPSVLSIPIAMFAAFFGFRSWRINKTKLNLELYNIYAEFTHSLELFKDTLREVDKLMVKKKSDVTIVSVQADLPQLGIIIDKISKNEEQFKKGSINTTLLYIVKDKIMELETIISLTTSINISNEEHFHKITSGYGFFYYTVFLTCPSMYPKQYKQEDMNELNFSRFLNYYMNLVWSINYPPLNISN